MPKVKLATNRGDAGINLGSPLSPVQFNPNAGGSVRITNASVNPNVGNARYTDVPNKPYVQDNTMQNVLSLENTIVKRTQELTDQKMEILAQEAIGEYQDYARKMFYGDAENKIRGYAQYEGVDAMDRHDAYQKEITSKQEELLLNLDPAARKKALIGMHDIANRYLNKGASHYAKAVQVGDIQKDIFRGKEIRKDIDVKGSESWSDGSVLNRVKIIKDPLKRDAEIYSLAEHTIFSIVNKGIISGKPIDERISELDNAYKSILKSGIEVSGDIKDKFDHLYIKNRDALLKERASSLTSEKGNYIKALKSELPNSFRQAFVETPNKGMQSSLIQGAIASGLNPVEYIDKGMSSWIKEGNYSNIKEVSYKLTGFKQEIVENQDLTKTEKVILLNKADNYILNANKVINNRSTADTLNVAASLTAQLEADPEKVQMIPAPSYMDEDQKRKFNEIQLNTINEYMNGIPKEKQEKYEYHNEYYDALSSQGLLTQDDLNEIKEKVYNGEMSPLVYTTYQKKLSNQKIAMNKVKAVKRTEDYIIGNRMLDSAVKNMIKKHPKDEIEIRRQQVILEGRLVNSISKSLENNQPFDVHDFALKNFTSLNRGKTKMKPIVHPSDVSEKPVKKTETTPTFVDEFGGYQETEYPDKTEFTGKKRTKSTWERWKEAAMENNIDVE
jgi:hypothetical protein